MTPAYLTAITRVLADEAGQYAESQTSDPVEQHRLMLERLVALAMLRGLDRAVLAIGADRAALEVI